MDRKRFRQRSSVLAVIAVVLLVVACGRATEQQIDQALGITPTPTADATADARASEVAATEAASSEEADPNAGNAALGRSKFQFNCQTCHSPDGSSVDLLATGGVGTDIDYATLYPILREGEGHSPSPGPYAEFTITDADIANIGAYIREQSAP